MNKPAVDDCVHSFLASALQANLEALTKEIDGVKQGNDPEYIHRMRVATRRLRNGLKLYKGCVAEKRLEKWQRQVRKITRSLGQGRDLDVQLETLNLALMNAPDPRFFPGIKRLLLRIKQARIALQEQIDSQLDDLNASGSILEMELEFQAYAANHSEMVFTAVLYRLAARAIQTKLHALMAYSEIVDQAEKKKELHQMRIAMKWLRYTLEVFAPMYPAELKTYIKSARRFQELLGIIHDDDVWLEYLPKFLDEESVRIVAFNGTNSSLRALKPGLDFFLESRFQEREHTYAEFVGEWHKVNAEILWEKLIQTVKLPVFWSGGLYPPLKEVELNRGW